MFTHPCLVALQFQLGCLIGVSLVTPSTVQSGYFAVCRVPILALSIIFIVHSDLMVVDKIAVCTTENWTSFVASCDPWNLSVFIKRPALIMHPNQGSFYLKMCG